MPQLLHQASRSSKPFVSPGATKPAIAGDTFLGMARETFGKHFIRQWREFQGLSLRQLEARLEIEPGGEPLVSYASLGRIERFIQPYSQPILEARAIALSTTPAELLEVDPLKQGEVVDLLRHLPRDKREEAERFIRFIANK